MELYYIRPSKFMEKANPKWFSYFRRSKAHCCEKRREDYAMGRFLVTYVLKNYYNIEKPKILLCDKKPYVQGMKICFSISHTNDFVGAVFDKNNVGFDVEDVNIKRNFSGLQKRYNLAHKDPEVIYRIWTSYEASLKLFEPVLSDMSFEIEDHYCLNIASCKKLNFEDKILKAYELVIPDNGDTPQRKEREYLY